MAHRQWACADEAFPTGAQLQTLDRAANRIGPVKHPDRLAMPSRSFEDVAQGRDERIDPTPKVLQVDKHHIERVDHLVCRLAHLSVETENRNTVYWIVVVRRLDHVVLLVAAQTMLGPESGADLDVAARDKRIQRMRQILRNGGRVREQRQASAFERRTHCRLRGESIDTEIHGFTAGESS